MTYAVVAGAGYRVGEAVLLDDVSLEVGPGELVAIIGPNGAGKTTLLSLLAGDLAPSSGIVAIDGEPTSSTAGGLARRRAVLPQHHLLQFAFRCLDVVMLGRYPLPTGAEEDHTVVARVMAETDTSQLADRIFPTLSGGEQTRVSFARILAQEAPLVLLDEPTASLDLRHQELVMSILRGLADGGGSVVAVLHDINLAARHSDRIVLLDRGRVRSVGSPVEVLTAETIASVYGHPVEVMPHPETGSPLVVPLGRGRSPV